VPAFGFPLLLWRRRPEAIFDEHGRQIGTHFGGPTWKLDDGSAVVGEVIAKADAAEPDAIQWLLLGAKSHEGSGSISAAAYIRRTETKGGIAPGTGCDASHLSEQARVCYSASYQFFSEGKNKYSLARQVGLSTSPCRSPIPVFIWNLVLSADSDEVAHRFRDDLARRSEMMSPGWRASTSDKFCRFNSPSHNGMSRFRGW
jgi:hypothetical protein